MGVQHLASIDPQLFHARDQGGPFEAQACRSAVRAPHLGQNGRCTMSGTGDEDGVQIILVDQPVEVGVGETLAGVRAPVAQ